MDIKRTATDTDTASSTPPATEADTGAATPPVDDAGQDTGGDKDTPPTTPADRTDADARDAEEGAADAPAHTETPGGSHPDAPDAAPDGTAPDAAGSAADTDTAAATPAPDAGGAASEGAPEPGSDAAPEAGDAPATSAGTDKGRSDTSDTTEPSPPDAADSESPTSEARGAAAAAAAVPAAAGMAAAGMAAAGAATPSGTERASGSGAAARAAAPPQRRSAVPLFLGGVVAAGLGLGAGWYAAEEGWIGTAPEVDLSAQDARIAALSGEVEALGSRLAELAEGPRVTPDDLAQVESGVQASLDSGFAELTAQIEAETQGLAEARAEAQEIAQAMGSLLQRLERAEAVLADLDGIDAALAEQGSALDEALSALSVRVASIQGAQDGLREEIGAVRAIAEERIEDIQAAAAAAAAEADRRAALAEARAALDTIAAALQSGAPFAPALARVETATDVIGQPLRDAADSGVATVGTLQEDFGPAARAGLSAALQGVESDSAYDRLGSFLRSQIGARSLQPREGDDPDAVMSRATQAVNDGDIAAALDELDALPSAGQAAMSGWMNAARARMDALSAFDALAADMTAE
ncbi:MAG: hypothetical protein JJU42_10605 [Rhodobacteraceae bacterium]|nr:hypothetical protein [Paracoccaceae bacterium]